MDFFTFVPGAAVLLFRSGNYLSAPLYTRDDVVYAKMGSAFIKLHPSGQTSVKNISHVSVHFDDSRHLMTQAGKLVISPVPITKAA